MQSAIESTPVQRSSSRRDGRRHLEDVFDLLSRTASHIGEAYFPVLVKSLSDVLGCHTVFVADRPRRLAERIRPLAVVCDGEALLVPPFDLADAAASATLNGASHHAHRAQRSFPNDGLISATRSSCCLILPLRAADGTPNGFLGVGEPRKIDDALTVESVLGLVGPRAGAEIERLHANQALREQAELTKAFMDRAQDLILRTVPGAPPVVEYVNPAFERFTGYPATDLYRDPALLLRLAHPDDRENFSRMLLHGDTSQPTSWRWIRRDGSLLWTEGRCTLIHDDRGAVVAIETIARDVTAQKNAERRAEEAARRERLVLDAIPDTILRVDRAGTVLSCTPSNVQSSPLGQDDPTGKPLVQLLEADASSSLLRCLAVAMQTGVLDVCRFEVRPDAVNRIFEARVAPIEVNEAVVFIRDITGDHFLVGEHDLLKEELELKAGRQILRKNPYSLTFREFTVLELVASGMTDKQIAVELGISLNTVGKHVSNVLGKMDVSSRTEASVHAVHEHLLD